MVRASILLVPLLTASCGPFGLLFRDKDDPRPRTCGNGQIDTRQELACAPCTTDNPNCPCSPVERSLDVCDGADLGGRSCRSLGYLGGKLSCSRMCELDVSACQRVAGPASPPRLSFAADHAALSEHAGRLSVLSGTHSALTLRHLDLATLSEVGRPTGMTTTVGPAGEGGFGPLFLLADDEADRIAVHQYGNLPQTVVFRAAPDGSWRGQPVAVGRAVAFVRGDLGLAWLVVEGARVGFGLDVVRIAEDGRPVGAPIPTVTHDWPYSGNHAAALWTGQELVVVAGSNGNAPPRNLIVARVSPGGELRSSHEIPFKGSRVALAAGAGGNLRVIATRGTQAFAFDLSPSDGISEPVLLGAGSFNGPIVAATAAAWLQGFNKLYRAGPEGFTVAAKQPGLRFEGAVPSQDGVVALLGDRQTLELLELR